MRCLESAVRLNWSCRLPGSLFFFSLAFDFECSNLYITTVLLPPPLPLVLFFTVNLLEWCYRRDTAGTLNTVRLINATEMVALKWQYWQPCNIVEAHSIQICLHLTSEDGHCGTVWMDTLRTVVDGEFGVTNSGQLDGQSPFYVNCHDCCWVLLV